MNTAYKGSRGQGRFLRIAVYASSFLFLSTLTVACGDEEAYGQSDVILEGERERDHDRALITIDSINPGGSGCKLGEGVDVSAEGDTIHVTMDELYAQAGPDHRRSDMRKFCQVLLKATPAPDYKFAITEVGAKAFTKLGRGAKAEFKLSTIIQGEEPNSVSYETDERGRNTEDVSLSFRDPSYSGCGETLTFSIKQDIRLKAKDGFSSSDVSGFARLKGETLYRVELEYCGEHPEEPAPEEPAPEEPAPEEPAPEEPAPEEPAPEEPAPEEPAPEEPAPEEPAPEEPAPEEPAPEEPAPEEPAEETAPQPEIEVPEGGEAPATEDLEGEISI